MKFTILGAALLLGSVVAASAVSAAEENLGHYCSEKIHDFGDPIGLRPAHSFGNYGSGIGYTCGPNGCHQAPAWVQGSCESHGHVALGSN